MKFLKQKEKHIRPEDSVSEGKAETRIHPIWQEFIRFCQKLGYGEITKVKIQDKLPVLIEIVCKKIKFGNHNDKK